jgi:hypothetical protein
VRPKRRDIAVPPFPAEIAWIGSEPPPVDRICARGPLLVHFVDVAHVSSVRTLPYLAAWAERYEGLGLRVVAVNSPRFPFTADLIKLEAALARLDPPFPVACDSGYAVWHAYGCEGWPSLFLWGSGGALRWYHFGEGEYQATEVAIQDQLRGMHGSGLALPEPMAPLRPSDTPGALVAPPSEEIFPGGSASEPWVATTQERRLELEYAAGGVWASVDGTGSLEAALDDGSTTAVEIVAPGAYRLTAHPTHQSHNLLLVASAGLSVYSLGFEAAVPEADE